MRLDTTELVHRPPGDVWGSQPSGWADPRQTATNRFAPAVVVAMVAFDQDFVLGGSGLPSLALTIGGRTRQAAYSNYLSRGFAMGRGRSASQVFGFHYTLQPSDFDGDGLSIAAGALTLPAGTTLRDAEGETALLGLGTHAINQRPGLPDSGHRARLRHRHDPAAALGGRGPRPSLTLPAATGDGSVSHALTPARRPGWPSTARPRVLSGTPSAAAAAATYTWTATDGDDDATALAFTPHRGRGQRAEGLGGSSSSPPRRAPDVRAGQRH